MAWMESAYPLVISAAIMVYVCALPRELTTRMDDPLGEAFSMLRNMLEGDAVGLSSAPLANGSVHHIETRSVEMLPGGGHRVVTHFQKRRYDDSLKGYTNEERETEIVKHANHTIKMIVRDGENMTKRNETQVGCVEHRDCELSAYCDKFAYQCKPCHTKRQSCTASDECCPGYRCDEREKICLKSKGQEGDKCDSKDDCNKEFCCALDHGGDGVCQPYLNEGEDCGRDPFLSFLSQGSVTMQEAFSGLPARCPCKPGLRCKQQRGIMLMTMELCSKPDRKDGKEHVVTSSHQDNPHATDLINPLFALLGMPMERNPKTKHGRDIRWKRQASNSYGSRHFDASDEDGSDSDDDDGGSSRRLKRRLPIDMVNAFLEPAEEFAVIDEMEENEGNRVPETAYNGQKRAFIEDFTDARNFPRRVHYEENLDEVFENIMKGIIRAMKYVF